MSMTSVKTIKVSSPAATETESAEFSFQHYFSKPGMYPFDEINWEKRRAVITGQNGQVFFEQDEIEVPDFWSQMATNVVVSKYFRGKIGTPERETSVKQMVGRVANTITEWGKMGGYLSDAEAAIFNAELTHLLIYQKAAFNSPVWFNVGVREKPQCSACFILSVDDNMESILDWIKKEGMIFKHGSGSGVNLSKLRSSKEKLSLGGTASGPVSFMRGADASAGAIKSGGTTRRAAKMVILNIDHPDIVEFIRSKELEEKKAWALGSMGYDMSLNGAAWQSIQFQNANNSVRVTDEFMKAYENDEAWHTRSITEDKPVDTFRARDLMKMIAEAAWVCGDPGMQFDTTINDWHTCPNSGRINGSNPCSEYMHLDNSACNLASLNLMKFVKADGEFDVEAFVAAVNVMTMAQDIIVGFSSYPTLEIAKNALDYRQLGLGYANLGALLMSKGLPYDSDEGRAYAAAITALMTGVSYSISAKIAARTGPFAGYMRNREPMLGVILKHRAALKEINNEYVPMDLMKETLDSWDQALALGEQFGYRNSQVTLLAPTGTIAFLMDCDTTGVEPDIALVKYKTLVGGGLMKIINNTVPVSLNKLGYGKEEVKAIIAYIDENETVEGANHLQDEHLPIFDCAFKPVNGNRSIHYMGHLKMMGAVQPFLSGAISKTVNMDNSATSEEIAEAYYQAWKLGIKALAIYRDGSKRTQPLVTSARQDPPKEIPETVEVETDIEVKAIAGAAKPIRHRLPDLRHAFTHKFTVAGHEGYITVGLYEDGKPGEIFVTMSKEGSTISGLMDAFATSISIGLQYGMPLKDVVRKFTHMRFEPSGFTKNPDIPIAKSIIDYIFQWLGRKFLNASEQLEIGLISAEEATAIFSNSALSLPDTKAVSVAENMTGQIVIKEHITEKFAFKPQTDAPTCADCGSLMIRNASCYKCWNCGATSGCS
ncbi:ribonucleoside-diphosphate reductase, adenosylcobalamin-dependent [Candidatus Uhrbacteria bacterium RIFCSPLOWO2_12_FULL_46_10]|uniref:Vitamin B12-dependent ribonucleotide reductase n=1 Tax=Candidatus Uhrbacteria bacterium RIFCSPLOWO2_01_FULL_47_25 TaxID=1802402 RepID=A0A1F7UXS3_9BACT|nr:MAG: ribonucleoside-diphosphate reductase, adenosylcobalamin-dependent [Candidatus Uhrbacteria bacterium RIFCSPHIGHO2_01_FULL_46_23]OGL68030.1 MAG: ribonucleoside-diphosphate reductase, adenosylcobalamin-dependent [Candidatus Uhrbacteria bacterium RIFCSPHIGHO2_02_FULL_47_29]OGL76207.1 MAG: ribonucleoside-diphosphate reductase, adenosylcobalamin-dependent [Candidatus Uhrbacteria bacterium RIFCSPHIGHO2_12_FULL_46_13]OGL82528.1 MAG: ribonucleoside-diphosphate reductase, adenosylcobalamin-depende